MKKLTKPNLITSLQMLGIIFLIFFVMAFECGKDNGGGRRSISDKITVNTGGTCSTEQEFKKVLTHGYTYLDKDYEKTKVVFNTFDVEGPMHYKNTDGETRYMTMTDNAYRVTTDFDLITEGDAMRTNKVYRTRFENAVYMFYTAQWSDGLNCINFGIKNTSSVVEREVISGGE